METLTNCQVESVYAQYGKKVESFVYFKTGNSFVAEEIKAKVFAKITNMVGRLEWRGNLQSYVYSITRNCLIDYFRKNSKEAGVFTRENEKMFWVTDNSTPFTEICQKEKCLYIRSVIDELPDNYKIVIELRYLQELSLQEICDKIDISLPTLKHRLHKAKRLLRKWLTRKRLY
jgi:RNA polymerase sigma-70 factor (ECF subfamily)